MENFFGRIFMGGFFWEDFFGGILWEELLLFLSRFWGNARRNKGRKEGQEI